VGAGTIDTLWLILASTGAVIHLTTSGTGGGAFTGPGTITIFLALEALKRVRYIGYRETATQMKPILRYFGIVGEWKVTIKVFVLRLLSESPLTVML